MQSEDEYEKDWWITEAMRRYGGGFVRDLGELWRRGDPDNQKKLKSAFSEYWERYAEIAKLKKEEMKKDV